MTLVDFIRDSNLIEGIDRAPLLPEIKAHELFLSKSKIVMADLADFVLDGPIEIVWHNGKATFPYGNHARHASGEVQAKLDSMKGEG